MNPEQKAKWHSHIEALADGKLQEQCPKEGTWHDTNCLSIAATYNPDHYRRKPKPASIWHWKHLDGGIHATGFSDKESCEFHFKHDRGRAIEFVEQEGE